MIYLYAVPKALEKYRNLKPRGQVTYQDHTVRIPAEAVDDQFVQNLRALIRRLSADKPARRVPSPQECRFCDISAADYPERVDEPTLHQGETLACKNWPCTKMDKRRRSRKTGAAAAPCSDPPRQQAQPIQPEEKRHGNRKSHHRVGDPQGRQFEELDVTVDTGSTYTEVNHGKKPK